MRVLIYGSDTVSLRAAASLASHPDIATVGLADANPPAGWGERVVRARRATGFDVIIGKPTKHTRSVTVGAGGTVTDASAVGLGRSLGVMLGEGSEVAMTEPGKPRRSLRYFDFPPPVGRLLVTREADATSICATDGTLAAVGAANRSTVLSIIDHPDFLGGVCLAAAALLPNHQGPVWKRAAEYLALCEQLGLVQATAPITGA